MAEAASQNSCKIGGFMGPGGQICHRFAIFWPQFHGFLRQIDVVVALEGLSVGGWTPESAAEARPGWPYTIRVGQGGAEKHNFGGRF